MIATDPDIGVAHKKPGAVPFLLTGDGCEVTATPAGIQFGRFPCAPAPHHAEFGERRTVDQTLGRLDGSQNRGLHRIPDETDLAGITDHHGAVTRGGDRVAATAGDDQVIARDPGDGVSTTAILSLDADDPTEVIEPDDAVIADEHIFANRSRQRVVARSANHLIVAPVANENIVAGTGQTLHRDHSLHRIQNDLAIVTNEHIALAATNQRVVARSADEVHGRCDHSARSHHRIVAACPGIRDRIGDRDRGTRRGRRSQDDRATADGVSRGREGLTRHTHRDRRAQRSSRKRQGVLGTGSREQIAPGGIARNPLQLARLGEPEGSLVTHHRVGPAGMDGIVAEATEDVVRSRGGVDGVIAAARAAGRDPRRERITRRYAHRALIAEDVIHPTVGTNDIRPPVADDEVHSGATDNLILRRPALQAIDTCTTLNAELASGLVAAHHDQVVAGTALETIHGARAATIDVETVVARSAIKHKLRGDALTHIHGGVHHTSARRVVQGQGVRRIHHDRADALVGLHPSVVDHHDRVGLQSCFFVYLGADMVHRVDGIRVILFIDARLTILDRQVENTLVVGNAALIHQDASIGGGGQPIRARAR